MSAAHTPGPWELTIGKFLYVNGKDAAGKRVYITQRDHRFESKENMARIEADCRLIAAAPDLLNELIEIAEWARVERAPLRPQEIDSILRLIAKATGEQS